MTVRSLIGTLLACVLIFSSLAIAQDNAQPTDQNPAESTPAPGSAPATPQIPPQVTLFNQAVEQLRNLQIDDARTNLQSILDRNDHDITQYMAQVLLMQLNGSYAARQQAWLNRQPIDTLVLVPDLPSFYAALGYWTDTTYFPVLIDDGWFAPLFAHAYKPKHIVRFTSSRPVDLPTLIGAHNKTYLDRAASVTPPPGLVVIDPTSPTAAAGYALALGRFQPVLNFHSDLKFNQTINLEQLNTINTPVMQSAQQFGLLNLAQWIGITLAADLPLRYRPENQNSDFAVDDALGRETHGLRLAVVGRLTGDVSQSIYQAMCSLFCQPANTLLFDDYSNRNGPFVGYRQNDAARLLATRYAVTHVTGDDVTPPMLRKLTRTGGGFDMLWLNTSGGGTYLDLHGSRGHTDDMPLGHASVIHAIHSWSAQQPDKPDTLAGRAIVGGCYWYFGSLSEPYLNAFMEPTFMAERALCGTPLAFAARQVLTPHPMYKPWKLYLVGDPLFILRPKPAAHITSNSTLPPDYTTLEPPVPTTPATPANFRPASLFRPDLADAMAERLLTEPHLLDPTDLAMAMWFADAAGRTKLVTDVPIDLASKQPVAQALLLRNAISETELLTRSSSPADAEQYLAVVFHLETDREIVAPLIKPWMAAMAKQQRDAVAFLTQQKTSPNATGAAKSAIAQALAPPEVKPAK